MLLLLVIVCAIALTPVQVVEKYRPRTYCEVAIQWFEDQLKSCVQSIPYGITGDDLLCSWTCQGGVQDYTSSHGMSFAPMTQKTYACTLTHLRSWGFNIIFADHIGTTAMFPLLDSNGGSQTWSWVVRISGMNTTRARCVEQGCVRWVV